MSTTKEEEATTKTKDTPKQKRTPRIPIGELLAHGDPETAHLPKTWKENLAFPFILSVVFFLSLLTFHYAPHALSTHKGFKIPEGRRPNFEALKRKREADKLANTIVEDKPDLDQTPPQQQAEEVVVPVPMEDPEPEQDIPEQAIVENLEPVPGPEDQGETHDSVVTAEETNERAVEEIKEPEMEQSNENEL